MRVGVVDVSNVGAENEGGNSKGVFERERVFGVLRRILDMNLRLNSTAEAFWKSIEEGFVLLTLG
jgi:hypothetical protein